MEPIFLFFIIFILVSLGSYLREYVIIMMNLERIKDNETKVRKPSAHKTFTIGVVGAIILVILNILLLKLDDTILMAAAIGLGWFGFDLFAFLSKKPETLFSIIPGIDPLVKGYQKFKEEQKELEKDKDKPN